MQSAINCTLQPVSGHTFEQTLTADKVRLWSPETPAVYGADTRILRNGTLVDRQVTRFGFRDTAFDAQTGFHLNGEPVKFKGVCLHHDAGNLGAAVPKEVLHRRLKMLKKMGFNAIRTAHNPFAPEFYDMCDSLGFLVMAKRLTAGKRQKRNMITGPALKSGGKRT